MTKLIPSKKLQLIVGVVVAFAAFAGGCSKGGEPSRGGGGGWRSGACGNCNFADFPLVANAVGDVSTGSTNFELSLDFYGSIASRPYNYIDFAQMVDQYMGPVGALGDLIVQQDYDTCGLAPGRYELQTLSAGQFVGNSTFRNLQLVGVLVELGVVQPPPPGRLPIQYHMGEQVVLTLNSATGNILTAQGMGCTNYATCGFRVQKEITINSVGGVPCSAPGGGPVYYYMY